MDAAAGSALVVIALAASAASVTIAKSNLFAPLRVWVSRHGTGWSADLIYCPYCLSHWLAGGGVLVYRPQPLHSWLPFDLFVSALVVVALASFSSGLIIRAFQED